ncbi:MAG: hypothetical protein M3O30_17390 [Planctomycetota bacterium]|nr:hypothetical protein [Planctomycetota bacterium]
MAKEEKTKTTAELKADYDALARKCTAAQLELKRRLPEIQARVEAELAKSDLNLKGLIDQKRQAYIRWEKQRDMDQVSRPPAEKNRDDAPTPLNNPYAG